MGNTANVEVLGHYSWLLLAWALSGTQPVTCTEDKARNASPGSWQGKSSGEGVEVEEEKVREDMWWQCRWVV